MGIKIGKNDFDQMLLCPFCNGFNLHHLKIEVFERDDDAKKGLHTTIHGLNVNIDQSMQKNPSHRRQGLSIQFFCESCGGQPILLISQHKGETHLKFREATEEEYLILNELPETEE